MLFGPVLFKVAYGTLAKSLGSTEVVIRFVWFDSGCKQLLLRFTLAKSSLLAYLNDAAGFGPDFGLALLLTNFGGSRRFLAASSFSPFSSPDDESEDGEVDLGEGLGEIDEDEDEMDVAVVTPSGAVEKAF